MGSNRGKRWSRVRGILLVGTLAAAALSCSRTEEATSTAPTPAAVVPPSETRAPIAAPAPRYIDTASTEPARIPAAYVPRRVIVIVIDTLRADFVGVYGSKWDTTPYIDSIAEQGVVFNVAISNSSYTLQSVSTLFSGLYPSNGGQIGPWAKPPDDRTPVPKYFEASGYRTGFTTNQILLPQFGRFFELAESSPKEPEKHWKGNIVSEKALSIVDEFGDDPYFMYVHYEDPHGPYAPSEEYYRKFQPNPIPEPEWMSSYNSMAMVDQMEEQGVVPGYPKFDDMVLRYAAEVAMTDDYVRAFLEGLRERGHLDDALVIITADHGEEFWEHGFLWHSWTLYEESIRIPMILWSSALERPARNPTLVSLADILPSLLDVMGTEYDDNQFDGRSWFDSDDDWRDVDPSPRTHIAELIFRERTVQRVIVDAEYKFYTSTQWWEPAERSKVDQGQVELARAIRRGEAEGAPLWEPPAREMLFNLKSDPAELVNLHDSEPGKVAEFQLVFRAYQNRVLGRDPTAGLSDELDELDEDTIERLKAMGYL